MEKSERIAILKFTALNKIRKLYRNNHNEVNILLGEGETHQDKVFESIRTIIEELDERIKQIKKE